MSWTLPFLQNAVAKSEGVPKLLTYFLTGDIVMSSRRHQWLYCKINPRLDHYKRHIVLMVIPKMYGSQPSNSLHIIFEILYLCAVPVGIFNSTTVWNIGPQLLVKVEFSRRFQRLQEALLVLGHCNQLTIGEDLTKLLYTSPVLFAHILTSRCMSQ